MTEPTAEGAPSLDGGAAALPTPPIILTMPQDGSGGPTGPEQGPVVTLEERLEQVLGALEEEKRRRAGLDRQNRQYDQRLAQMEQALNSLTARLETPPPQGAAPSVPAESVPEPAPQAAASPGVEEIALLRQQLAAVQADARLTGILTELSQPGQPGEGQNLLAWRHRIRVLPMADTAGKDTTEAQRQEVLTFLSELRSVRGQAATQVAQQMTGGMTPGSRPAPAVPVVEQEQAEFDALHAEIQNTHAFRKLPKEEQKKKMQRYDEMIGTGYQPTGQLQWSRGWPNLEQMQHDLHKVTAALKKSGQLPPR